MDSIIDNRYLITLYSSVITWLKTYILTWDGIYQGIILTVVILISFWASKIIKQGVHEINSKRKEPLGNNSLNLFLEFIFPLCFFLITVIIQVAITFLGWNNPLTNLVSSILGAWIIIKILNIALGNSIWSKLFSGVAWFLAILNILGLLPKFLNLLDKIAIDTGSMHLSLLLVFKGFLLSVIFIWTAVKLSNLISHQIEKNEQISPSLKVLISKSIKILFLFIAIVITLKFIGLKLTAFTIFSGAIGVGIGFGLQKIFSNFISGFILLMDKSIKPGDIIEIDSTYGTIQSMSSRYITILTFEGKEHLIPNEDLITQRVINWSHSNRFIKISILVGVSYDTDIPFAMELAKKAISNHSRILKNKPIFILLDDFAESSINIKIQGWISDPENGIENVKSDIRLNLWKLFKEHNIEIPFPQRDIHIIKKDG